MKAVDRTQRDKPIKLAPEKLYALCEEAIRVLNNDPIILNVEAPVNVLGDIHGQFYDLLTFFQLGGLPPQKSYLCLGDFVDRGENSIETISYLLALKIKYPGHVWLLRGNHETPEISDMYGFREECDERYGTDLFPRFTEVFRYLPLAAIIGERIFCVHGGLSPDLTSLDQLRELKRPLDIPPEGLLADLLWADPSNEINEWEPSERGTSYMFPGRVVRDFLDRNEFDLLCRGHQCVPNGFEFPFPEDQSTLTVFSAPDYCGEMGNKGAMLKVDAELRCSFEFVVLKTAHPDPKRPSTGGAQGKG
jgi:serine/threonine-protein phosphatase PP1 catalytic subunit